MFDLDELASLWGAIARLRLIEFPDEHSVEEFCYQMFGTDHIGIFRATMMFLHGLSAPLSMNIGLWSEQIKVSQAGI